MIAMAAVKAVGSIMQGVGEMQADRQNATNAIAEGHQAMATSEAEATRVRRQVAAQQGTLRAEAGAQGTTFAGSPMEVYTENAAQGELMAQDRIYQGRLVKRSKKMEANMYQRKAQGALLGGIFGALGAGASAFGGSSGGSGGTS
jgi:hypothetical protein